MNGLRDYLISMTIAAILCAILLRLTGKKGTAAGIVRLLTGIFMTATVLSPVVTLDLSRFSLYPADLMNAAENAAGEGTAMAENALDAIIISETEAYIQDKAASMGATLEVEVLLRDHLPYSVHLSGAISPGAKANLIVWIRDNLDIPSEELQWN